MASESADTDTEADTEPDAVDADTAELARPTLNDVARRMDAPGSPVITGEGSTARVEAEPVGGPDL